jgi:hypothetical protein
MQPACPKCGSDPRGIAFFGSMRKTSSFSDRSPTRSTMTACAPACGAATAPSNGMSPSRRLTSNERVELCYWCHEALAPLPEGSSYVGLAPMPGRYDVSTAADPTSHA